MTKTHSKSDKQRLREVRESLARSDELCRRAVLKIYENQSKEEQETGRTIHRNGVGFRYTDDVIGSNIAEKMKLGRIMSPNQMVIIRKFAERYARQLTGLSRKSEKQSKEQQIWSSAKDTWGLG